MSTGSVDWCSKEAAEHAQGSGQIVKHSSDGEYNDYHRPFHKVGPWSLSLQIQLFTFAYMLFFLFSTLILLLAVGDNIYTYENTIFYYYIFSTYL